MKLAALLFLVLFGTVVVCFAEESPLSGDESDYDVDENENDAEEADDENNAENDEDNDEERDEDGMYRNQLTQAAFKKLWDGYPKSSRSVLYSNLIGGQMTQYAYDSSWRNTCAIRLSYTLNRCGRSLLKIPKSGGWSWKPGNWRRRPFNTKKGADGNYYSFRVRELAPFILDRCNWPKTWTNPRRPYRGGRQIPSEFKGKKGIIFFDVKIWSDATGHLDLFDGSKCRGKCYFSESKNAYLWVPRD